VPEDAQLALPLAALLYRFDGPVDAEELMVACQDLSCIAGGLIK